MIQNVFLQTSVKYKNRQYTALTYYLKYKGTNEQYLL